MKNFKDSKFGKLISKVSNIGLDVAPIIAKASGGNIVGAISDTFSLLKGEESEEASKLLDELTIRKKSIELDFYRVQVQDRESARNREVEIVKTGKTDYMMLATGITGLSSFMFTIYAVVYIPEVRDNDLFIHLMGMIEGVVIGNIFAYYYGTSVKN